MRNTLDLFLDIQYVVKYLYIFFNENFESKNEVEEKTIVRICISIK